MNPAVEFGIFILIFAAVPAIALAVRFTVVERRYRTIPHDRRRRLADWSLVYVLAYDSIAAWPYVRVSHLQVIGGLFAVLSLLVAVLVLIHVTNWRGWGKRLQEQTVAGWRPNSKLPYRRPRGWMPVVAVLLAPLAIVSDLILLIVLLA